MLDTTVRRRLTGVFTALVSPMKGGEIDLPAFEAHLERQLDAGVNGVSPIGTTGEASTLSDAEADQLITTTVKRAAGRAFVMVGAGANATRVAIEKARRAADLGADGVLVVVPYYNKPTQAGIVDHFAAVAQAVRIPVMLYNVPGRTGIDLSVESCAKLFREVPNIVAIKEAGGRIERITELRLACGDDIAIMTGDDALVLPALAVGADGVYSVASNIIPAELLSLRDAWRENRAGEAQARFHKIYRLLEDLFIESNPVPVKAALAQRGHMQSDVRAPLASLSAASWKRLEQTLREL
jgi:4-hydroxy-tetrahydrodipicolinate synthase